ncbi:MAG: hypothetical protein D6722_02750, partial [Bacteroidetes bacterium]
RESRAETRKIFGLKGPCWADLSLPERSEVPLAGSALKISHRETGPQGKGLSKVSVGGPIKKKRDAGGVSLFQAAK